MAEPKWQLVICCPRLPLVRPTMTCNPESNTSKLVRASLLSADRSAAAVSPSSPVSELTLTLGSGSSVTWPMRSVPSEIFEIFTTYLTRSELKALRLVCKEFDTKISAIYFRNVVVPFSPEIYARLNRDDGLEPKDARRGPFSNGMRLFRDFGPYVLRFALSLELDEAALAYPPLKTSQQAIPTFWGIYRWPHEAYLRYPDIEHLEQTADETDGMKEALAYLTRLTNIGLCCDAGLGFLPGPEYFGLTPALNRQAVFATKDWRIPSQQSSSDNAKASQQVITVADCNEVTRDNEIPRNLRFKHNILKKMVTDAGYSPSQVDEAIQVLLQTERTTLANVEIEEVAAPIPNSPVPSRTSSISSSSSTTSTPAQLTHNVEQPSQPSGSLPQKCWPLIPASLTRAQLEFILELEWAHRAMIQSFVISIIDNALLGIYDNLTSLTIAKIPSAHVHFFCRHDIWRGLSNLSNVSLGVIADWRRVSKTAAGVTEDTRISPVKAVGTVFKLMQEYMCGNASIESIHFEWLCGGELAYSPDQRNLHVLPAPFLEAPEDLVVVKVTEKTKLLHLPHIKHLSLKNCWSPPHVLLQTVRRMALASLKKLELESFSLSGPPSWTAQAPLLAPLTVPPGTGIPLTRVLQHLQRGMSQPWENGMPPWLDAHHPGVDNNPLHGPWQPFYASLASTPSSQLPEPTWYPDWLSWAGIIDHFSPSIKACDVPDRCSSEEIRQTRRHKLEAVSRFIPAALELMSDEANYNLASLSFKSCGYVAVDVSTLRTRKILPASLNGPVNVVSSRRGVQTLGLIQSCNDRLLASISSWMPPAELAYLEVGYRFRHGWEGVYDEVTCACAFADGVRFLGLGRFSGTIENPATRNERA